MWKFLKLQLHKKIPVSDWSIPVNTSKNDSTCKQVFLEESSENDQAQLLLSSLSFRREDDVHCRLITDTPPLLFPRLFPVMAILGLSQFMIINFLLYLSLSNLRHLKHYIKWGEKKPE